MSQIFHPAMNHIAKVSILGLVIFVGAAWVVADRIQRSPYITGAQTFHLQTPPFSHEHHVRGLGIDCRYCHTSVEDSSFAGIPPTETCITCHSQIWKSSPMLEPVRVSFATNQPLVWIRVHNLPQFVYFNHSIHVAKGIGCSSCHGQIDRMPLTFQQASLRMEFCLECHRNPEDYIRPKSEVFNMDFDVQSQPLIDRQRLVVANHIQKNQITNCSVCHR